MVCDGGVRCPFCNKNLKIINLLKHLRKVHDYYDWPSRERRLAVLGCEICGSETMKISDIANHQHGLGLTPNEENKERKRREHFNVLDDEADSTTAYQWTGATPVEKVEEENKSRVHHASKDGRTDINSTEKVTEDACEEGADAAEEYREYRVKEEMKYDVKTEIKDEDDVKVLIKKEVNVEAQDVFKAERFHGE